jgi:hypothetical protein
VKNGLLSICAIENRDPLALSDVSSISGGGATPALALPPCAAAPVNEESMITHPAIANGAQKKSRLAVVCFCKSAAWDYSCA